MTLALLSSTGWAGDGREPLASDFGFERPLRTHELLGEWHRQTRRQKAPGNSEAEPGKAPTLAILTVSNQAQHHRLRPQALTGRLAERRARFAALIDATAKRHGIDPELVHAVIRAESSYNPRAKSPAGACGLMQLMPATAERFGVRDRWDPAQNIRGGVAYLRLLMERFDGDLRLVLAAYNAGEGAVAKYGNRVPPYRETRAYVRKVMGYLGAA
ncbi:lytic transglycosylase domain-containing protein [Thiohalocapsa marina]|uniref:Lytic transglycosylase domain-containing protein n=1 Tax=Thiohalocapsa marina TaxID=424902 RepID=A0A5M8FVQ5_9GAMM|nr:lytic transglycosylase domain-containing protein [Thiohalocapsa marina]